MKFIIDDSVFRMFPELTVGVVIARDIDNTGTHREIDEMLREREREIRAEFSREILREHPRIAVWRQAYSKFGAKPKKHLSSVENLCRMVIDGIELRHINTLVDLYNYISLKHLIPVGGDDLDRVHEDIRLTIAEGTEPFTALNTEEVINPRQGEVIYRDAREVLCRRWNWRECDKSKMTEATIRAALVIEGLPPATSPVVEKITDELEHLIRRFCRGATDRRILDRNTPATTISSVT